MIFLASVVLMIDLNIPLLLHDDGLLSANTLWYERIV